MATNKLKKALFDEQKYRQELERLKNYAEKVEAMIEQLVAEGFPSDKAFIERITSDEMAFDSYIKEEYNAYLQRIGFVPAAEKKRILATYNELYWKLNPVVQAGMAALQSGIVLTDAAEPNEKKIEEIARERATKVYNVPALQKYFDVFSKASEAIAQLKQFEKDHGLRGSTASWFEPISGTAQPSYLERFGQLALTAEDFQRWTGDNFIEKQ